ncbi:MAG: YfhO family protein [Acutalibacteraceae bacterium]|nr:YfhO family protein [Acutalibacteraceae bacterium]
MLKQKRSFWDEYKYIIISFLASAGTMLVIYLCNSMIPLGDNTILRMDLYHQYGPLFAELYERVTQGDSLLYSWASGLGSCFLGNYFNYLSSPIGAIVLFFGHKNVTEAIAAMILIKAALSSACFTYYLKRSLKSNSYAASGFGIMYAFCGYMLAYYWNVMWLDAMVLLPIVLLGIERIIDNGKMKTFVVGLALSMFSNYYMSYMLCVFSVIYFFYYFIKGYSFGDVVSKEYSEKSKGISLKNNRFIRSGFIFAFGALCAAGLMAVILLPVFNVLQSCSATNDPNPTDAQTYFNYFDFFANHLASLTTTIRSSGDDVLPNVYCGALTLILAPLFFFTKSISKKEKLATIGLLGFLYISFNVNFLNFAWHGFHFPNDLPYRQSFIYSFILVLMAYKTFIRLNEFKARHFGVVGAALIFFTILVDELTSKNVTSGTVLLSMILFVIYVVVLTIFCDKRYQATSVAALLVVCICSEAIMCDTSAMNITITKESYVGDYEDFSTMKDTLDTIEDGNFYRMELSDLRTRMDPSWYYYNGASVFSSMAYERLSNLQDDLGMMSNRINSYTYNPQTPVYNMMFSMKYIVNNYTPDIHANSPNYTKVATHSKYTAYKNNYYLPVAYLTDTGLTAWGTDEYIDNWKSATNYDPFNLQGEYFNLATGGVGNPFQRLDPNFITYSNIEPFTEPLTSSSYYYDKTTDDLEGSATFYLIPEKSSNVYIYFKADGADSKDITVNSPLGTVTHNSTHDCILDLGYFNAGETVTVNIPLEANTGNIRFFAYTLNKKIMDKGYKILSEQQMLVEEFEDTKIKGRFTAEKDSLLYTSIPYDKGWSVLIDGEKVPQEKIVKVGEALLGVMVEEGNHDIEFKFSVSGFKEGALITLITILLIAAYYLLKKLKSDKFNDRIEYSAISDEWSDDVLIPEKITEINDEFSEESCIPTVDEGYPVREIISPKTTVTREVFAPKTSHIEVTEVHTEE